MNDKVTTLHIGIIVKAFYQSKLYIVYFLSNNFAGGIAFLLSISIASDIQTQLISQIVAQRN
jgi:hypothetical protein